MRRTENVNPAAKRVLTRSQLLLRMRVLEREKSLEDYEKVIEREISQLTTLQAKNCRSEILSLVSDDSERPRVKELVMKYQRLIAREVNKKQDTQERMRAQAIAQVLTIFLYDRMREKNRNFEEYYDNAVDDLYVHAQMVFYTDILDYLDSKVS